MFGVKYDNKIVIKEGTEEDLKNQGFVELFEKESEARIKGFRLRDQAIYQEFMGLSLQELDSVRAKELEQLIWKYDKSHPAGYHIAKRKENLIKCEEKYRSWDKK